MMDTNVPSGTYQFIVEVHFLEENVRCSCLVFLLLTYFRYLCCIKKLK